MQGASGRATTRTPDAVVRVRDLHMAYGSHTVIDGIDLDIAAGEVVALLGPNGAGKTTTIEILEGFRRRSAGHVEVFGVDPEHGDEAWRSRLGIVFQSWRDHGKWRVHELLTYAGRHYAHYATPARPRPRDVDALLAIVGLQAHASARIKSLSGGERRRLDVALGLVGHPELVFLDEPTAGFDPQARRDFHDLLHRLSDLDETTVLLTTHDLHEAEQVADRLVILAGGRIVGAGSADHLARSLQRRTEVRWWLDGSGYIEVTDDPVGFVADLRDRHGAAVVDVEVRRPSLEDVYLALVEDAHRDAQRAAGLRLIEERAR